MVFQTLRSFSPKALFGVTMIMIGCCLNVVSLEFITKTAPGAGWLLTFLQFALVTSLGFLSFVRCGPPKPAAAAAAKERATNGTAAAKTALAKPDPESGRTCGIFRRTVIPLRRYLVLTAVFFLLSVINNKALDYKVSVPLHTVFRSSSLTASLIIGFAVFGKRYSVQQVCSCLMVTLGIVTVTLADSHSSVQSHPHGVAPKVACCGSDGATTALGDALLLASNPLANSTFEAAAIAAAATTGAATKLAAAAAAMPAPAHNPMTAALGAWFGPVLSGVDDWFIGVSMLFVALWLSAILGHMQDYSYEQYGREPDELMFWTHLLSMPGFVVALPDMYNSLQQWLYYTAPVQVRTPFADPAAPPLAMSVLWMVAFNVGTQFLCIRGVHTLTSATNTLTTTVAITMRKFVSLLISVVYFQHAFTLFHWIGSVVTFAGVYWYTYAPKAKSTSNAASTTTAAAAPATATATATATASTAVAAGGSSVAMAKSKRPKRD